MKFNTSFTTQVLSTVFDTQDDTKAPKDVILVLTIDLAIARKILFRYESAGFTIGEYKMIFKFDNINAISAITLFRENNMYILKEPTKFILEVEKGYDILIKMESIIDISTFDFSAAVDVLQDNKDEVAEEDEEGRKYGAYF